MAADALQHIIRVGTAWHGLGLARTARTDMSKSDVPADGAKSKPIDSQVAQMKVTIVTARLGMG